MGVAMDAETGGVISGVWAVLLTSMVGYISYTAKKRDVAIDANTKGLSDLALKAAETYATKPDVMALFTETARTNEMAIARVEKSIETTNATIAKQGDKIDHVSNTINTFQTNVMSELAKKT